jgi:outer membrane protein OmpA-like peptidoglycan-associated protein
MSWKKAILAATILAVPGVATAQPAQRVTGLYVGVGAGVNWVFDGDVTLNGANFTGSPLFLNSAQRNGSVSYDLGYAIVASLGWGYGNGVRTEFEVSYRNNSVDAVQGFGQAQSQVSSSGRIESVGLMLNGFYDFELGWPVTPYVGLGLGALAVNNVGIKQQNNLVGTQIFVPGSEWVFGYQAIIGAALPIASVPGLAVTAEYRYTAGLDLDGVKAFVTAPGAGRVAGTADTQYATQSILIGLRYAFNAAPAAAPAAVAPAAAPAPARTFLVFFDWDRADLTDRARQIIAEAATNAQRGGVTRIEVSGHADRTGTPQYNMQLSMRRAQNVAAELERRGIVRSAMTLQAFGETRPLVPTADNVREPQNRRVEIILR